MRTVLPDLSIRQLEYLVAVAEEPTWAAAAEEIGVSPSALSQGLAELERRVGVVLFERQGRRRVLRPETREVLEHARRVLALTGDLARWSERVRTGIEGAIRLGMIDVAAVNHYPDVLRRFRDQHPGIELTLRVEPSGRLLDDLVGGELELVVCVAPSVPPKGIITEPLLEEELAIYRPDGRRAGPAGDWGPWVLFPSGSHTRAVIEAALRAEGATVETVADSHQPEVLREMVTLGLGWTVLPVIQAETGPRPLSRARLLTSRRLVMARREGSPIDPATGALAASLARVTAPPAGRKR
jgi:DNA-binding transcriptional LysR family regulator